MAIDLAEARKSLKLREARKRAEWAALHRQAETEARAIVALIIERYAPTRIYQWGSILHPEDFRDYSDIDIAVEGLSRPEDLLHLLRDAEALTTFPLDIVELDKIAPLHAESIRRRGRCVYER